MDPRSPIEDQFSKLHPCLPLGTRIGIVGAGPSGISAAYALTKLGYTNITVFEKHHSAGGMCESVEIEGRIYDLGGQVLAANSAPVIFHLANEIGAELEEMDSHKLALIDSSTGAYRDNEVANDYVSVVSLTLELQDKAKDSNRIGVHAVSEFASDLTPAYLEARGFRSIPKSVQYGYTASGYGFVPDMPYAYIHEFTRTSIAGKIRRFKGGYTSLWERIGNSIPIKLLANTEVLSVRRDSSVVHIEVKSSSGGAEAEHIEYDKIIISGSFPFKNAKAYRSPTSTSKEPESKVLDMSELEKELFSKVRTIDYYTTVLKIKGFEHIPVGFYYFGEYMEDPTTIGNPVAMQRFHADTDIFLFWSYGNSANVAGPAVKELAIKAVNSMGGVVRKEILQRRFKYFPHVGPEEMKNGFYERLEYELQGLRNTYYVGGLMAFELTERNSSYAMALICKHFATTNPAPPFPYVKSLFHLRLDQDKKHPKILSESPGIEFPDLSTLNEYLKHWGTHEVSKNKMLYTWINDEGAAVAQRTYGELEANAAFIAHKLLTSQKPSIKRGDRVLLVHPPGLDFVDAFFGCLRARVIPVPVLPPDPLQRGGQALMKIENVAKVSNAVAILSTVGYHVAVRAGAVKSLITFPGKNVKNPARWPDLPWLHTDSWVKNLKIAPSHETSDLSESLPDDLCFLQFTSGSTGDAKGVMISQGGLIHNVKMMRRRYLSTSNTVLVSWLPQYHDMGLIGGLFTALVSGGSAILFSPMTFIKNPLMWLQTLSKYRATHSAGPNFALELVIRRLESDKAKTHYYDLSSLVFFMVAAEPVRQKTLKKFVKLTRPFGLSEEVMAPGYGLAENCVFVSCAFGKGKPILVDWQGRICCGYVVSNDEDVDLRIVDPDKGVEKEEGTEGEIWISSPSAGIGYWGRDELSHKTFRNELPNYMGRKYTRTGDLGRIIDGKLFITGRIKDLIIIAGRNIYSADVEKTVESTSELLRPGCCAVVGVPEDVLSTKGISVPDMSDQVGLVVIAEVRDGKPVDKDVVKQIEARVAEEHGVAVASVKLIRPRTISKTTSGKIKRFECLKQFVDGTLNVVPDPIVSKRSLTRSFTTGTCQAGRTPRPELSTSLLSPPSHTLGNNEIVEFLKGLVSDQTGIPIKNISPTESLTSYGIDSIGVVRAAQKLSDFLGVPVGAVDIFTATCIADLANFSVGLLMRSQPQQKTAAANLPEPEILSSQFATDASRFHQLGIWCFQLIALLYVSMMLILPAYLSVSGFSSLVLSLQGLTDGFPWVSYTLSLILAPFSWITCMVLTSFSIAFLGNSFLKPNYALTPEVSIWSCGFVKWWALYKAQEASSRVLAVHLRGTVFLKYWFEMLGARIGSSVLLDTVDITDPSLVSIGNGAVIAEGALIQGHQVNNGILQFQPIRIGRNSTIGPYAVIQKGSILGDDSNVPALQKVEIGKPVPRSTRMTNPQKGVIPANPQDEAVYHFIGIYSIGFLSSLSAAIVYFLYIWVFQQLPSLQHLTFICISGSLHWIPFTLVSYATIFTSLPADPAFFAIALAISYFAHGLILCLFTSILTRLLGDQENQTQSHLKIWLSHRISIACHLRFAKLLSGTEAFCIYLRLLGAKVGEHCSIRAINPVAEPWMISLGAGVHLGDFSRLIPGFYSAAGYVRNKISVEDNSVIGSQSLVLPGSTVEKDVILGALSIAPMNSVLQRGGVYIGSQNPTMIKNTMHALDERIEEMDAKYKKIVGNLAANLAATTLKVRTRYFHRIGVSGKGYLKLYDDIKGLPDHSMFGPGRKYPLIIRHSNSLSADDDARIDARGASVRILSEGSGSPLLDLTLKTGKAFYARTISDFATWLVCGLPAREEHVKRVPHIRDAVWNSLRRANSYAEMHYYSNICRLFRFKDGKEMYGKFKLRPYDETIGEDSGKVEPLGILPPETGAIPRDEDDTRPLLFLDKDFKTRVESPGGVRYIFQLQLRPIPDDESARDIALDCTKPWDEEQFPKIDIGEIGIDQNLSKEDSESLEFNPFLRCHEVDVIRAMSSSQSASIDHGRSLIYEICQHLRNGDPLPQSWRVFLEQSDVKVDLSGCPMAAALERKADNERVTLARTWYQTTWALLVQPLLQTIFPYFLLGLIIYAPLNSVLRYKSTASTNVHWLLPLFWVSSGILAALSCVIAKWVLVGKKEEGENMFIWSRGVFMDTIWQAFRTIVGDYFVDVTCGSHWYLLWMKLMGSYVELEHGAYVDSMGATLNPEMVVIEGDGCVGKEALLFGHVYDGEGGQVKFGKVVIEEGGFVGSRAVAMPGVTVESGGSLSDLSLAMKGETVRSR
ncbi:uncharacterized protein LOC116212053 isoform X2 [Punica granatum]|uniref:Uncharacterized protein LOC116212053 isoform X2 n=1 Tax=Punica granatum TaxID=22663 RepID=A0A218WAV8_PUNGR|nr:uncharacterized protein LOC116212053 isoform X2 [Punica granatum]OWM69222.1 hypothetical protein CDL15_Pgr025409 [Punica granatum]